MSSTLLYLQAALLDDRLFLRDFFAQAAKLSGPALLVHEAPTGALAGPTPDVKRIAFTGKRLSANLSEAMVPNVAVTGAQRGLVSAEGHVSAAKLQALYEQVTWVVLSPLVSDGTPLGRPLEPLGLLRALRGALPEARLVLFAANPLSPLGSTPVVVNAAADIEPLRALYGEETATLERAAAWAPVTIASARSLATLA